MRPVMVATDGSPTAELATQTAIELAQLLDTFLAIGSHGWGVVKRAIFGSVSSGVLHRVICPVLVVRGRAAVAADDTAAAEAKQVLA